MGITLIVGYAPEDTWLIFTLALNVWQSGYMKSDKDVIFKGIVNAIVHGCCSNISDNKWELLSYLSIVI